MPACIGRESGTIALRVVNCPFLSAESSDAHLNVIVVNYFTAIKTKQKKGREEQKSAKITMNGISAASGWYMGEYHHLFPQSHLWCQKGSGRKQVESRGRAEPGRASPTKLSEPSKSSNQPAPHQPPK